MPKGEKLVQRYEKYDMLVRCVCTKGEKLVKDKESLYGNGPRGSKVERITILGQEKHTSRGRKLMNLH